MAFQELRFVSDLTSVEQLLGQEMDEALRFDLFSLQLENPNAPDLQEFDSFFLDADFDLDLEIGLALDLLGSSLGDIAVSYPVFAELEMPGVVVSGKSFDIGGTERFFSEGAQIDAESLNFDGLEVDLTLKSDGGVISDLSIFNPLNFTTLNLPFDIPVSAFDVETPILQVIDQEVNVDLINGVRFVLSPPDGKEATGRQTGASEFGELDSLSVGISENLAFVRADILKLLANIPALAPLRFLVFDVDQSVPFSEDLLDVSVRVTIVSPFVKAGFALRQEFEFVPNMIALTAEVEGEIQDGAINEALSFTAPDEGDPRIADGTVDGALTFDLGGELVTNISIVPVGEVGVDAFGLSLLLKSGELQFPVVTAGPQISESLSAELLDLAFPILEDFRVRLPDDFFTDQVVPFSLPVDGLQPPQLLSAPDALQAVAGQETGLAFAPAEVRDLDTQTEIALALTVSSGVIAASSADGVTVTSGGGGAITLLGLQDDLTAFLRNGGVTFTGDQNATLSIVADDFDGFSGIVFPDIQIFVTDEASAGGGGGGGGDDLLLASDLDRDGETDEDFDPDRRVSFSGGAGEDTLRGADGADFLVGGPDDDDIAGVNGRDSLFGGEGDDSIFGGTLSFGGAGNDGLFGGELDDELNGGEGDDALVGRGGDDLLIGGPGDDGLSGRDGFDIADGGPGDDRLTAEVAFGGAGNDELTAENDPLSILFGGAGNDEFENAINALGETGNDTLEGSRSMAAQLFGGDDSDLVILRDGGGEAFGGPGDDTLRGGVANDLLEDEEGSNEFDGGGGDDTIRAGDGDDILIGGAGSDLIEAGGGDDRIDPGSNAIGGTDTINAGAGDDVVRAVADLSIIDGGVGDDTVLAQFGGDVRLTDLSGDNEARGDAGDDLFTFGPGDDNAEGGRGGDDTIRGGAGSDVLASSLSAQRDGSAVLEGGPGGDILIATDSDDTLRGGEDDDTLVLSTLAARVEGGDGFDTVLVGEQRDFMVDAFGEENFRPASAFQFQEIASLSFDLSTNMVTDLDTGETLQQFDAFDGVERLIVTRDARDPAQFLPISENDVFIGDNADNDVDWTGGFTRMEGGDGDDTLSIRGGAGEGALFGGAGDDILRGGGLIDGGADADIVFGSFTDDTVRADQDDISLFAGQGEDLLDFSGVDGAGALQIDLIGKDESLTFLFSTIPGPQTATLDGERIEIADFESLRGRDGGEDTLLIVTDFDRTVEGLSGDDRLGVLGHVGARVDGGDGNDTLILFGDDQFSNIEVSLGAPGGEGFSRFVDPFFNFDGNTLISIENVIGTDARSRFDDRGDAITGNSLDNLLSGRRGNDTLIGLGGDDRLEGGDDDDILEGGDGGDTLSGDGGDDRLSGGDDDDLIRLAGVFGDDVLDDFAVGDRIEVLAEDASDVTLAAEGADVVVRVDADASQGTLRVLNADIDAVRAALNVVAPAILEAPDGNAPPIPVDDAAAVAEDGAVDIPALANDADPDDDALTVTAVSTPANGAAEIRGGVIRYTPDADFNGTDSFTYDVSDGNGGVERATVTVTVTPENDAPVARPDRFRTTADAPVTGNLLEDNGEGADFDIDGDAIFIFSVNGRTDAVGGSTGLNAGSTVEVAADGAFTFDPRGPFDFLGEGETADVRFYYTLSDGADTVNAGVLIEVEGGGGDDENVDDNEDRGGDDGNDNDNGDEDVAQGGAGDDSLDGGAGDDSIAGRGGRDTLTGGVGADSLSGGRGGDLLQGNGGRDILDGGGGRDSLLGGGGRDTLLGGGGRDVLEGGGGRDMLVGGGGRDILDGGRGRDVLGGSNGADTLIGGRGNDLLTGGGGRDTFLFSRGDGRDRITDFDQLRDRIEIANGADSFADLTITQAGGNVRISFANGVVTVENDLAENFTASDFVFS